MGQRALQILGFSSIDEFMSKAGSLDNMAYRHLKDADSLSIFESILKSSKKQKVITIRRNDGRIISLMAKAYEIFIQGSEHAYELDISIADENAPKNSVLLYPVLRLPKLSAANKAGPNKKTEKIDKEWLEKVQFLLDVSKEEMISYLNSFTQNALKAEISLQNAVLLNDKVTIDKIAKKLAISATNLHITQLATIYNSLITADKHQYQKIMQTTQSYLADLNNLLSKENV